MDDYTKEEREEFAILNSKGLQSLDEKEEKRFYKLLNKDNLANMKNDFPDARPMLEEFYSQDSE